MSEGVPINEAATCHDCTIQETLDLILSEVRALRLERLPASPELIETLLAAIYVIYADAEFTAAWVLETCTDSDNDALKLRESIKAVIGTAPTINRLSRILRKVTGTYDVYKLEIANLHSRDGITFCVTKVSNFVTT